MARRTVTARTGGRGIDTTDFHDVVKACRKVEPALAKAFRKQMRAAGELAAIEARKIAGEHSSKIPGSIKVRVAGASVAIVAGGPDAPNAAPFELGNTGDRRSSGAASGGTFRHPVFGNRDAWVQQDMHRFLEPAVIATTAEMQTHIGNALERVVQAIVIEG